MPTHMQPSRSAHPLFDDSPRDGEAFPASDILHLAEMVPVLRERLAIGPSFPDDAIFASLKTISGRSSGRAQWLAAFDSNLGQWLAAEGRDLNAALTLIIALLPARQS